ncbi:amidase signature domain-containing protein [Phaeosphaeriaceae sp. PMI808]|nr:amidase signature domain-containing protein [Phaeosphaeriaceae sp. PMI808]
MKPGAAFNILTAEAQDLQKWLHSGSLRSVDFIEAYIKQIQKHNGYLHAVISTASQDLLLKTAQSLDDERSTHKTRIPLHGIPVLLKNPSGSSSGPAVAVSAGFALLSVGTETDGSLIVPAEKGALYSIKPTVGLVSQNGIVPVSHSMDAAGPMTKCPYDLALLLDYLVAPEVRESQESYTKALTEPWEGIGVAALGPGVWNFPANFLRPVENATAQINREIAAAYKRLQGVAKPYDHHIHIDLDALDLEGENSETILLNHDFAKDIDEYLQDLETSPVDAGKNPALDRVFAEYNVNIIIAPPDSVLTYLASGSGYPVAALPLSYLDYSGRPFGLAAIASARTPVNISSFSYTSGRYLFNESLRLKERHVEFNIEALQRAAEASVGNKHGKVISMKKLAEGGFNRVFVLQLQDGFELIAKIPYHIARPEYFATASEAATLTFLRLKGIPVPKVYSYSAKVENPVGTEYLLMEKAQGVSLASKGGNLEDVELQRLTHSFVVIEKKLFEFPFSATGSLYFKNDILPSLQAPLYTEERATEEHATEASQFCIGPIADYMFWYGRRAGLELNRGPWRSHVEYLQSTAQKEIAWTQHYGEVIEPDFPHNALGLGVQHPEDYLKLLESYQLLTPYLLPKNPKHPFNQPTLRHPDLTPGNIFITPESGRISCLIDWQHAIIQPQLLAAGYPRAFENPDNELSPELIEPTLPEDFESLQEEERVAARELYRRRLLFYSYRVLNGHLNQHHIAALRDPLLLGRQMLVDRSGRQWGGNLITLKGAIIRATQFWEHFPDVEDVKCPVQFDQTELDKFAEIEEDWLKMSIMMELWRKRVCSMTEEGWVRNEDFEEARKRLDDLKEELRQQCESDEEDIQAFRTGWPFRDHEEVD